MNNRSFWKTQRIISLSAFVISFATLFTIIYQTYLMDKQQNTSVWPYLEIWKSMAMPEGNYTLTLVNNGTGPAFIKEIKVSYNGETYYEDPATFFKEVIDPKGSLTNSLSYTDITKGRVIPARDKIEMLELKKSPLGTNKLMEIFNNSDSAVIEVVYHSLNDEYWSINSKEGIPKKM